MNITERAALVLQQIDEALELARKATLGPWNSLDDEVLHGEEFILADCLSEGNGQDQENAAFIAASRTLLPKALLGLKTTIRGLLCLAQSSKQSDECGCCNYARVKLTTLCDQWEEDVTADSSDILERELTAVTKERDALESDQTGVIAEASRQVAASDALYRKACAERNALLRLFCKDHDPREDESWGQYGCPVCLAGKENAENVAVSNERDALRAALVGWGMLYNTPPILTGDEWCEAFNEILAQTIAALKKEQP